MNRRCALATVIATLSALFASASCGAPARARAPRLVDHHVHVLSPQLVSEWKSIGVPFSKPDEHYVAVDALLERAQLDAALLVPMAHFYGNDEFRGALELELEAERARVAHENDYVAELAARHPRCAALASVDLLRPYAFDELARARRELDVVGVKLHLRSAGFDPRDASHVAELARAVAWVADADELLLLHLDVQREDLTREDVLRCLEAAFGPHSGARVVIAHLGGSGGFDARTQLIFEACVNWLERERAQGRQRESFWFDVSAVPLLRESEGVPASTPAELDALRGAVRRIGLERLCFGSDYPVFDPREHAQALAETLDLDDSELEQVLTVRAFARPSPLSLLR